MALVLKLNFKIWDQVVEDGKLYEFELFDKSSKQISIKYDKEKTSFYYNAETKQIINSENKDFISNGLSKLITVENTTDSIYLIKNPNLNSSINEVENKFGWLVLRYFPDNNHLGMRLRENDIIKLGRITFKIRQTKYSKKTHIPPVNMEISKNPVNKILNNKDDLININYNYVNNDNFSNNPSNIPEKTNNLLVNVCSQMFTNTNNNISKLDDKNRKIYDSSFSRMKSIKKKDTNMCRICLGNDSEDNNPIINVCKCHGSVGYIHLNCLKTWLDSKLITKVYAFLIVHSFKDLKCEICNQILPERIVINNEITYLIDLKLPNEDDYIILETLSSEKKDVKFLYIIHMPKRTKLLMGRSQDCDIRMTDISISRVHSFLENKEGEFYLKDNNSKFGTLLKLQTDMLILPFKKAAIQFEDVLIELSIEKSFLFTLCCKTTKHLKYLNEYNDYFSTKKNPPDTTIKVIDMENSSFKGFSSSKLIQNMEKSVLYNENIMTNRPNQENLDVVNVNIKDNNNIVVDNRNRIINLSYLNNNDILKNNNNKGDNQYNQTKEKANSLVLMENKDNIESDMNKNKDEIDFEKIDSKDIIDYNDYVNNNKNNSCDNSNNNNNTNNNNYSKVMYNQSSHNYSYYSDASHQKLNSSSNKFDSLSINLIKNYNHDSNKCIKENNTLDTCIKHANVDYSNYNADLIETITPNNNTYSIDCNISQNKQNNILHNNAVSNSPHPQNLKPLTHHNTDIDNPFNNNKNNLNSNSIGNLMRKCINNSSFTKNSIDVNMNVLTPQHLSIPSNYKGYLSNSYNHINQNASKRLVSNQVSNKFSSIKKEEVNKIPAVDRPLDVGDYESNVVLKNKDDCTSNNVNLITYKSSIDVSDADDVDFNVEDL